MSTNCRCSVCNKKYHYCGSCSPDDTMDLGCCSDACVAKVPIFELLEFRIDDIVAIRAKEEIDRLQAIVDAVIEMVRAGDELGSILNEEIDCRRLLNPIAKGSKADKAADRAGVADKVVWKLGREASIEQQKNEKTKETRL